MREGKSEYANGEQNRRQGCLVRWFVHFKSGGSLTLRSKHIYSSYLETTPRKYLQLGNREREARVVRLKRQLQHDRKVYCTYREESHPGFAPAEWNVSWRSGTIPEYSSLTKYEPALKLNFKFIGLTWRAVCAIALVCAQIYDPNLNGVLTSSV